MKFGASLLVSGWLLWGCALAEAKTPLPDLTDAKVSVAGVPDVYDAVREKIRTVEGSSPRRYFVAVVQSSGNGSFATRDYADQLHQFWAAQARAKGLSYASDPTILIVLAVGNRQLSVLPARSIQDEYGLRGQLIDRELVQPYFIPYARQDKLAEGLVNLVEEIEKWIARQEAARQQARQESAARLAQIQEDAEKAVAAAESLLNAVNDELKEKQAAGFSVASHLNMIGAAEQGIRQAREQMASAPQAALSLAQQSHGSLQQTFGSLQQLPVLQTEALNKVEQAAATVAGFEEAAERLRRDGIAVGSVAERLNRPLEQLDQARTAARSHPAAALAIAGQSEESVKRLREELEQLPKLRDQVRNQIVELDRIAKKIETELGQAKKEGVAVGPVAEQVAEISKSLATITAEQADYRQTQQQLDTAGAKLRSQWGVLRGLVRQHQAAVAWEQFLTRTLPIGVVTALVALAILVVVVLRAVHVWLKRSVSGALDQYKQQVVQLSDRLDALKERHRMLPFADTDFQEPMTGETLSVYNAAQAAIARHREKWLVLMDVWERAQRLIEEERALGFRRLQEARKIVANAAAPEGLQQIERSCAEPLDRLENGHERASELIADLEAQRARIDEQLSALGAAGLSQLPYQTDLATSDQLLQEAKLILVADPLGAQQVVQRATEGASVVGGRIAKVLKCFGRSETARENLEHVANRAAETRAQGLLLLEPEGNPDPLVKQGEEQRAAALAALEQADFEAGNRHLDESLALCERAGERINRQVAAKAFCEEQLTARPAETRRLQDLWKRTEAEVEQLEREFARTSWSGVGQNLTQARQLIDSFERQWEAAGQMADGQRQYYLQAEAQLRDLELEQQHAAQLLTAIGARLQELLRLRTQAQTQLHELHARGERVGQFLQSQTADRPRSNQKYRGAVELLREAAQAAGMRQPEWPAIMGLLTEISKELEQAEQMAQQDVRLAQQAAAEIAEAQRAIRHAKAFYDSGISADLSPAEVALADGLRQLQAQAYERAVELAASAAQAARRAHDDAVQQVQAKRAALEAQRRAAAARRSAAMASSSSFSISSSRSTSSSSSGASQSSWSNSGSSNSASSGASQSSW